MYPTDLTDSHGVARRWQVIECQLDAQRRRKYNLRSVFNALLYLNKTGCQWRMLPKEYPPFRSVHYYFRKWCQNGTWERLNQALNRLYRKTLGRQASPSLGILDAQSVKKSERGLPSKGFDGHKHVNGVKRQLIVDTMGLVLAVSLHAANQHDGQGAKAAIEILADQGYERLQKILADQGYRGQFVEWFAKSVHWALEIVASVKGISLTFQVVPQRWKVERTISWLQWRGHPGREG